VSLIRATPLLIANPVKPVTLDCSSRRPAADLAAMGPTNSRAITPVAGVPGGTARRILVTSAAV
jgi:hypothetical protein